MDQPPSSCGIMIGTRHSEENVHEERDSRMVTRRRLIKLSGVSTVLAALPPGHAKALIGKLLALETLCDVRELHPVLQRS